jgi:hypothetical protein
MYRAPGLAPKEAPTPATDSTPGPGVIIKKNTASAKVNTENSFR